MDAFFDKVMVMVENEKVRANRLALAANLIEGILHDRRFFRDRDRRQSEPNFDAERSMTSSEDLRILARTENNLREYD